jgi:hypothetical protein
MKQHPIHLHSVDRACGRRDGSRQRHWQGGLPAIPQLWGQCAGQQPASSRGQDEQLYLVKELSCLRQVVAWPPQDPIWPMNFNKSSL